MALSRRMLAQTEKEVSLSEMDTMQGERTVFSTLSYIRGQQWSTQSRIRNSKAEPRDSHAVCTLWVHPPTSSYPALQRSLQEVTSQDETFIPDISGYIWERVKGHLGHMYGKVSPKCTCNTCVYECLRDTLQLVTSPYIV